MSSYSKTLHIVYVYIYIYRIEQGIIYQSIMWHYIVAYIHVNMIIYIYTHVYMIIIYIIMCIYIYICIWVLIYMSVVNVRTCIQI